MKKKLKFFSLGSIIILILAMSLVAQNSALASLNILSVTLKDASGNNISAPSTAVVATQLKFNPDGNINTGDGIVIGFQSNFDVSNVVDGDVAITQVHGGGADITKGVADASGTTFVRIPITTESDTPSGAVTIDITNSHITTPTTDGTKKISIIIVDLGDDGAFGGAGADADTIKDAGYAAVVISPTSGTGTNLVTIYGNVDPTLSLELSDTTCNLGTLISTAANTCQYDSTVSTNASSGYTAYIKADGKLRNAVNDINDVAGGSTTVGSEEYGVATSYTTTAVDITATEASGDCTTANGGASDVNALALTTGDQSYATAAAPVDADVVTLCHSASIAGTTPAGVYQQVVTITVVGNF